MGVESRSTKSRPTPTQISEIFGPDFTSGIYLIRVLSNLCHIIRGMHRFADSGTRQKLLQCCGSTIKNFTGPKQLLGGQGAAGPAAEGRVTPSVGAALDLLSSDSELCPREGTVALTL